MKRTILSIIVLCIIIIAGTCLYYKSTCVKKLDYRTTNAYIIKDTIPLSEEEFNYFIVENQDEIDTLFDLAKIDFKPVDFSKEFLIAITTSLTNKDSKFTIKSAKLKENSIYIDFDFQDGEATDIVSIPSEVIIIEKPELLLDLYFIQDGMVVQKVALGRRNLDSPKSLEDFKTNYTGTFNGRFPCADCPGIDNTLTINPDNTYTFSRVYEDRGLEPFVETGEWQVSDDLVVLDLVQSENYFYIYDKNTVELMSPDLKRINSEFNYKLTRQ